MISGFVSLLVAGVTVKATLIRKSDAELPVVLNAETDSNGQYKFVFVKYFL